MLEAGIEKGLGSMAGVVRVGVRQVMSGTTITGWVMVVDFPGVPATQQPGFLDGVVGGMAGSGKVTTATILGARSSPS